MKLNTKGRYAVMAMVDLALYGDDKPVTLADIATRQEISLSYLEQLFAQLRKAGLVNSVRGPGGGYVLAKTGEQTSIAAIIQAVDESLTVTRCSATGHTGCMLDKSQCLTHDLWEAMGREIVGYLDSISLADVCNRRLQQASMVAA